LPEVTDFILTTGITISPA